MTREVTVTYRLMTSTLLVTSDIATAANIHSSSIRHAILIIAVRTKECLCIHSSKKAKNMSKLSPGCSNSQTTSKF